MAQLSPLLGHLLRRAGFGARPDERESFSRLSYVAAVDALTNYDPETTDIDGFLGTPGYVGITTRGQFSPTSEINDARQRWLFRMVHSPAPLQEKMALFWHNHFATAYSKIAGIVRRPTDATRMMAAKPSEDPGRRAGPDRDAARERARQLPRPARRRWRRTGDAVLARRPAEHADAPAGELRPRADGAVHHRRRRTTRRRTSTPPRACSPAGTWRAPARGTARAYYTFNYIASAARHRTPRSSPSRSTPTAAGASRRAPPRRGMQDGLDLIDALAVHPETGPRLARRLWTLLRQRDRPAPDASFVDAMAQTYLANDTEHQADDPRGAALAQFRDPAQLLPALLLAGRVRRRVAEGGRLRRASR